MGREPPRALHMECHCMWKAAWEGEIHSPLVREEQRRPLPLTSR